MPLCKPSFLKIYCQWLSVKVPYLEYTHSEFFEKIIKNNTHTLCLFSIPVTVKADTDFSDFTSLEFDSRQNKDRMTYSI